MTTRRPRHRGRLFWRIYGFGLFLMLAIAASSAFVFWAVHDPDWEDKQSRISGFIAQELRPLLDDPAALTARLERFGTLFDGGYAVYGPGGTVVAVAGGPPPGALDAHPGALALDHRRRHTIGTLPLDDTRYLRVRIPHRRGGPGGVVLIVALLVLAVVSWPFARGLVRPLEQLTDAARRLGDGDLQTRVDVRARGEVGALARTFNEMAERLAGIVARERQLIADVSHELKTPLARLRVAIELAAEDDDPAAVHALLADMGGDLDELDGLVSTLLDSARLDVLLAEVDRPSVRREPVDLVEASRAALDRLRRRDPAIEAALIGGPVTVEGDGGLIGRLLDNLLVNAARHGAAPIVVRVEAADDGARLEVEDAGDGVTGADLEHLFEPFFRADRSRDRRTGGSGLGLSLCRRIVTAHGGAITAENLAGGFRVSVTLPTRVG